MSLSDFRYKLSLKFRLALSYAACFFVFSAGIFLLVIFRFGTALNENGDALCEEIVSQARGRYILGGQYGRAARILSPATVSSEKREMIDRKYPGADILFAVQMPSIRQSITNIVIWYNGDCYELRIAGEHITYAKQLRAEANLRVVRNFCDKTLLSRGRENLSLLMLDNNGVDLLNPGAANSKNILAAAFASGSEVPFEYGAFRYSHREMPDGRIMFAGWNTQPRSDLLQKVIFHFIAFFVVAVVFGVLVTILLTRRFIRGIKTTTLAMNRISAGDYSYRVGVTHSDREILELMETFNTMNERTERLLKEIKMMSDNVAHDLRTPLTRISATVELLLRDRTLDEKLRNSCVLVAEETQRMKELVNTIMDISRTNSRPEELKMDVVDVAAIINDFYEFMQPAFESKNVTLKVAVPDAPVNISADRVRFQQVLANLLENALKFTDNGGCVTVSLIVDRGMVELMVSDTGCGISEEDQKQIFERFYRADSSRHQPGNGLGLALVQAIIRAHKWEISVQSAPGKGTCFKVTMPAV